MDLIYRYDPFQPIVSKAPQDTDEALQTLCDGNGRMIEILRRVQQTAMGEGVGEEMVIPICPIAIGMPLYEGAVLAQAPFALCLGCSDARAPVEHIFDLSFNNLFVVRIAGNVLGTECLGSIDYAVRQFNESLKVVLVLGHTGCGAVTAAVDTYLSPRDYGDIAVTFALRSLVDRVMLAVRGAAKSLERIFGHEVSKHPNYRQALVSLAIHVNAAVTAYDVQREVRALGDNALPVVFAVFNLGTMMVRAFPGPIGTGKSSPMNMFCPAPESADQLAELGARMAEGIQAERILS